MTTLLAKVSEAMEYLGMSPDLEVDATTALESAIQSAQARLEAGLNTRLVKGEAQEVFLLDSDAFSGVQPDGYFRLQCRNGFLAGTSPTLSRLNSLTMADLGDPVDSTDWVVDRDLGVVYVRRSLAGSYLLVAYQHGFESADDLTSKQPWVREALLSYVPMILAARRDNTSTDSKPRHQGDIAEALSARYLRNIGFCLRPVYGQWQPYVAP